MNRRWTKAQANTFADALDGRGPAPDEFAELVDFAEHLCEVAVEPSPKFTASLRAEIMSDAQTVLVARPKTKDAPTRHHAPTTVAPKRKPRRVAIATAFLLTVSGMFAMIASSANAIPGDLLYPVKRSVESVQLVMHQGDVSRGEYQLSQASKRLNEAKQLASSDDPRRVDLVAESLTAFTQQATSGSDSLFDEFGASDQTKVIKTINSFAAKSSPVLAGLSDNLPPNAKDAFTEASRVLTSMVDRASAACSSCTPPDVSALTQTVRSMAKADNDAKAKEAAKQAALAAAAEKAARDNQQKVPPKSSSKPAPTAKPSTAPSAKPPESSASPPPPTEVLGKVTKPVVGGLLGDEDQPGLVPGLLGGLLGGGK